MAHAPRITNCLICGRPLDTPDPLSSDCGGDCWGCMSEIEAELAGVSTDDYRKNPEKYNSN